MEETLYPNCCMYVRIDVPHFPGTTRAATMQVTRCVHALLGLTLTLSSSIEVSMAPETSNNAEDPMSWWTHENITKGTTSTYSVIVVRGNPMPSSQFGDEQRVRYFRSATGGSDIMSVQFASQTPEKSRSTHEPPFGVEHPGGADKRVRLVFLGEFHLDHNPNSNQVGRWCGI